MDERSYEKVYHIVVPMEEISPKNFKVYIEGQKVKIVAKKKIDIPKNPNPKRCRIDKRIDPYQRWQFERQFEGIPTDISAKVKGDKLQIEFVLMPISQKEIKIQQPKYEL